MIFASDLDRTIFYSCKSFEEKAMKDGIVIDYVDVDNGLNKGIMTSDALQMLKRFTKRNTFIPVTAREERHFIDRVLLKEKGINFDYVILGNGSKIYYKDIIDKTWAKQVEEIKKEVKLIEIYELLESVYGNKYVRLSSYGVEIRKNVDINHLNNLIKSYNGVSVGQDHRFMYVLVDGINKLKALKYVMDKLGKKKDSLICAGDSFMDIPMVKYAEDKGIFSLNGHFKMYDKEVKDLITEGIYVVNVKNVQTSTLIMEKVKEFSYIK